MKLKTFKIYVETKTGLHIGGWNSNVEIGGMDNAVIKDRNWFPYIPWSSLKGKLRSLYEISLGEDALNSMRDWFKTFDWINFDEVSMFFWKAWEVKENIDKLWPTRFIFRDLKLKEELTDEENKKLLFWKQKLEELIRGWESIYEEKMEVSIDRFTWTVSKSWPRPLERVPAWVVFEWELIVRFFEKKEILQQWWKLSEFEIFEDKFWKNLKVLKDLLENDYLWWQWSRWSGHVKIVFEEMQVK